jgi:hypothetical protein
MTDITDIQIKSDKSTATYTIDTLYDKYANDQYMYNRINNYINNQLPTIFESMQTQREQRVNRNEELSCEQDIFIQTFLNNNQYFYNTTTDRYFFYDGLKYIIYNEDDILHHVLSSISRGRSLMSWKHKTKINIMKRIRENTLTNSIPESNTIQMVLNSLCPTVFNTRDKTKYFLTVIGDNILRKNTTNIHFISPDAKSFIKNLNNVSQMLLGSNISQTFKYKYHDHSYNDCRIINMNDCIKNDTIWTSIINQYALDILCISMHYSTRYKNSDDFLLNDCNDTDYVNKVFYIKNMDHDTLINEFIKDFIDIDDTINNDKLPTKIAQITWKNMQYIWKQFLDNKQIPSIIFSVVLKNLLITKLGQYYNVEMDTFIGICSKFIPSIQTFLHFWNNTMVYDDTEYELEIDEFMTLLRKWGINNNESVYGLSDTRILDLINYYYPNIIIEDDKYIKQIRCNLWNKHHDVTTAINATKTKLCIESAKLIAKIERPVSPSIHKSVSIYDLYQHYYNYIISPLNVDIQQLLNVSHSRRLVVSKSYFEKYIQDYLNDYIIDNNFISPDWYLP